MNASHDDAPDPIPDQRELNPPPVHQDIPNAADADCSKDALRNFRNSQLRAYG